MIRKSRIGMMKYRSIVVTLAAALSGCASTHTVSGDFGPFLKQELMSRGAHFSPSAVLPPIEADWDFKPDKYGFVAFVHGDRFREVDEWLRDAFGEPWMSTEQNTHGQPQRMYHPRVIGVALQFWSEGEGVTIVCVKKPR
jgi:hypothetical protein